MKIINQNGNKPLIGHFQGKSFEQNMPLIEALYKTVSVAVPENIQIVTVATAKCHGKRMKAKRRKMW